MAEESATPDALIARMAARQYGVVSIGQLRTAGLSDDAVLGRVRSGRLYRVHRGTYAVGHAGLSFEGRSMAAVFACGEGAVLSHRSAASLWTLLPVAGNPIDITVATASGRRKRAGIRLHRCESLAKDQITRHRGIPVTVPTRTLENLRLMVPAAEHRRAIRQAEALGLPLGSDVARDRTRSELEFLFLRLCRRHRLPTPEVNVRVGRAVVDFLWPEQRLIVETDGYRYHRGAMAFESDRVRDLELRTLGYEVIRLTYRQVTAESKGVARAVREALALSSAMSRIKRHSAP